MMLTPTPPGTVRLVPQNTNNKLSYICKTPPLAMQNLVTEKKNKKRKGIARDIINDSSKRAELQYKKSSDYGTIYA